MNRVRYLVAWCWLSGSCRSGWMIHVVVGRSTTPTTTFTTFGGWRAGGGIPPGGFQRCGQGKGTMPHGDGRKAVQQVFVGILARIGCI